MTNPMPTESSLDVKFEIGHVLFVDIVNAAGLLSMKIGFCISVQQLKIDPVWDRVRNDPGFQQLLAGKEHIGPNK